MRSLLNVPADSAATLDAALRSGADALIIDLDGVTTAADRPVETRRLVRDFLRAAQVEASRPMLYIRIEGSDGMMVDTDLATIMMGEPDGIVLGRCRSGLDVQQLGAKLAVQEAEYGLIDGETGIIAEAGVTARSLFAMGSYADASVRLLALAWNADSLALDLGSERSRDGVGLLTSPYVLARNLALIAARGAEVAAIDAVSPGADPDIFRLECETARRDGFNAKIAVSPEQVSIINAVFDRGL